MRVTVVDPPAYTPPYDHALCEALADRGHEVTLATSHFRYGPVPAPGGYRREECFYRLAPGSAAAKALQHPLDMLRLARRARAARTDIVHFQWLPIPNARPRCWCAGSRGRVVLTAHDVTPREVRTGARGGTAARAARGGRGGRALAGRSARAWLEEAGVPDERVHVIPHGAFAHLAELPAGPPPAGAGGPGGQARRAVLRPRAPLQGSRPAGRGARRHARTTSCCSSWACRACRSRRCEQRARELGIADRVRFVPRFVPDAEVRRVLPARRRRRCFPTARSSSRVCSTRRSRSARRCC